MADAQALAHIIYTVFPCIDRAGKFLMQRGWDEVNMYVASFKAAVLLGLNVTGATSNTRVWDILLFGYSYDKSVNMPLRTKHRVKGEGDVIFDGDEEVSAIQPAQTGVQGKSKHVPYTHQNLKPGNIMIVDDGVTPILMDFSMKLLVLIEPFGYKGDRKFELELLKRAGGWGNGCGVVAIETEGIRHAICDMSLLIFNLVLLTFTFKSMDVCKAARILEWNLKRYPHGVFFLFGTGRLDLVPSQPTKVLDYYVRQLSCRHTPHLPSSNTAFNSAFHRFMGPRQLYHQYRPLLYPPMPLLPPSKPAYDTHSAGGPIMQQRHPSWSLMFLLYMVNWCAQRFISVTLIHIVFAGTRHVNFAASSTSKPRLSVGSGQKSLLQLLYATESRTAKKLKQIVKLRA
ncbi:uncharacterized protein F5147DRAFT_656101 [Suillus discolor]|uniref:Protein kinase domain-containing protein n=1 Tax=Suillus discolor TaxID=1912936 RepID=A0A9P7F021_9AGAM|nr:uncharacterized protein F5147DRAFT_656101 [Suillus discolor]KAG2098463.1 hypothetical protein F5147DRAFT_656101 [Suillus discolor]